MGIAFAPPILRHYRRRNAPNARGPSPTLISPITFSSTASMTLSVLLSQFATMIRLPSAVAAIPSGIVADSDALDRRKRGEVEHADGAVILVGDEARPCVSATA